MIFEFEDNFIDLNELEYVSKVIKDFEYTDRFYFRYELNGYVYNSNYYETKEEAEENRKSLINAWKKVRNFLTL